MQSEIELSSRSPPYADPIVVLSGNNVNNPIDSNIVLIERRGVLYNIYNYLIKLIQSLIYSFPILLFVSFLMYEIVLAGYNCVILPNNNLGWIRASFFLNIPWVLCIFLYIGIIFKNNRLPSMGDFMLIILLYTTYFSFYFFFGIYGEIGDLTEIRTVLNNSTAMGLLTCPTDHYRLMFGLKIAHLSIVLLGFVISISLLCFFNPCNYRRNNQMQNYDRFISPIVNRWRNFMDILYQRHREEVVITYREEDVMTYF